MSDTATSTKTCTSCKYWNATDSSKGECRRHAPQTVVFKVDEDVQFESSFPVTKSDDWCGDFES